MKISIEKNRLFKTLTHVQSIVERKNTIPILSNILLEAVDSSLILSSTDMDISITESINCSVIEKGSVTVPAHTLYDIVRKIPDGNEIEFISNDGSKFSIRSGKSKFSLSCLPKSDFPIIEIDKLSNEFSIESKALLKLLDKTRFAISSEETRYFLNGVYFHKKNYNNSDYLCLVTTDGHRLAKIELLYPDGLIDIPGVIIPKKTINELCKLLTDSSEETKINLDPNKIIFYIGNTVLISKLIDGNFEMIRKGKNNPKIKNNNINWINCNAEELPFKKNTFDKYIISFCLRNTSSIDRVLTEALRTLKPGGSFYCMDFATPQSALINNLYNFYKSKMIPLMGQHVVNNKKAYQYLDESISIFPHQDILLSTIKEIGFANTSLINLFNGILSIHKGYKI